MNAEQILEQARFNIAKAISNLAKLLDSDTDGAGEYTREFKKDISQSIQALQEIENRIGAYHD